MPFEQHPTDPDKLIMRAGRYNLQKPWVPLTDEEIKAMDAGLTSNSSFYAGALWAEAKLKEKNT